MDSEGFCSERPQHRQPVAAPKHSLSASDMMMLGLFPPSSRVTLLRLLLPAATWIRRPTCRVAETETSCQCGDRQPNARTDTEQRTPRGSGCITGNLEHFTKSGHSVPIAAPPLCALRMTMTVTRAAVAVWLLCTECFECIKSVLTMTSEVGVTLFFDVCFFIFKICLKFIFRERGR